MNASLVIVIFVISAILYLILPVTQMRERVSNNLSNSQEDGREALVEFSDAVRGTFGSDDMLSDVLEITGNEVSSPPQEETKPVVTATLQDDGTTHLTWREEEKPVRYHISFHGKGENCAGPIQITTTSTDPSLTIRLPEEAHFVRIQSEQNGEQEQKICTRLADITAQ